MTLTDYAIIALAGFPGWLALICMGADYIQTRQQSFDDATDWDRLIESSFHNDGSFSDERL